MVFTISDATRRCLVEEYGIPEAQVAWVRAGRTAGGPNGDEPARDRYSSQRICSSARNGSARAGRTF